MAQDELCQLLTHSKMVMHTTENCQHKVVASLCNNLPLGDQGELLCTQGLIFSRNLPQPTESQHSVSHNARELQV